MIERDKQNARDDIIKTADDTFAKIQVWKNTILKEVDDGTEDRLKKFDDTMEMINMALATGLSLEDMRSSLEGKELLKKHQVFEKQVGSIKNLIQEVSNYSPESLAFLPTDPQPDCQLGILRQCKMDPDYLKPVPAQNCKSLYTNIREYPPIAPKPTAKRNHKGPKISDTHSAVNSFLLM